MSVGVLEGDYVDDVKVAKVWTTGKVDLENGRSVHQRNLIFCAGANHRGARFTTMPGSTRRTVAVAFTTKDEQ